MTTVTATVGDTENGTPQRFVTSSSTKDTNAGEIIITENSKDNKAIYERELSELMRLSTERRHKWRSRSEFFLASLSYLIGYDSTFAFMQCFGTVGVIAIVPFVLTLIVYGVPVMYLEMTLGQYSSLDPPLLFRRVSPAMAAIGYMTWIITFFGLIGDQSVLMLCFALLKESVMMIINDYVTFASCHQHHNTEDCVELTNFECNLEWQTPSNGGCVNKAVLPPNQLDYFYNLTRKQFLNHRKTSTYQFLIVKMAGFASDRMPDNPFIVTMFWMLICWGLIAMAAKRGIGFVCQVSYVNAVGFMVLLAVLFISGSALDGGLEGLRNFLNFNVDALWKPDIWVYTFTYISTCFKLGQGGLVTIASYNDFHANIFLEMAVIIVAAFFCPFLMILALTPLFSALFRVLSFSKVYTIESYVEAVSYFVDLDGIVTTTASLTLLDEVQGGIITVFVLFTSFLCLGNQVIRMTILVNSVREQFHMLQNKFYLNMAINVICITGFLFTCLFASIFGGASLYLFQLVVIPMTCSMVALFEMLTIAHMYGSKKMFTNIHAMLFGNAKKNRRGGLWRMIPYFNGYMMLSWGYITPFFVGAMLFATLKGLVDLFLITGSEGFRISFIHIFPFICAFVLAIPMYVSYKLVNSMMRGEPTPMLFRSNLMLWGPRKKAHRVLAQHAEERWGV